MTPVEERALLDYVRALEAEVLRLRTRRMYLSSAARAFHDNGEYKGYGLEWSKGFVDPVDDVDELKKQ